jgi:hypothetical protein
MLPMRHPVYLFSSPLEQGSDRKLKDTPALAGLRGKIQPIGDPERAEGRNPASL